MVSVLEKAQIQTYEQAVEYLYQVPKFTEKHAMEQTKDFLKNMGSPDKSMKIIHIAGTNGKGSVCAYLQSILMEAGCNVGMFTSPHLISMTERIRINQELISKQDFLRIFLEIMDLLEWEEKEMYHPSFFEFLFFICMRYFEEKAPDYVILETGLGGRLDATNTIEKPILSIITEIGYDHMEYLGDTLTQIAGEKAGIIRSGVPVVFLEGKQETAEIIRQIASERNSKTEIVSKEHYTLLKFKNKSIDFSCYTRYYNYIELSLKTSALYQMENVALAVRSAELILKEELTAARLKRALKDTSWTGRMEEVLPDVYVDGAHNTDGIRAFLESLSQKPFSGKRYLIFGVVKDKQAEEMTKQICESRLFSGIGVTQIANNRTVPLKDLADLFGKEKEGFVQSYLTIQAAYEAFEEKKQPMDCIYIAGSLYLVGEFMEYLADKSKTTERFD